MRVAIIGAGLSGLALAFYLLERGCRVDIFDQKGVGGGASGMACGLVHPYPGEECRRSWRADEALRATAELLNLASAASWPHVVRTVQDEAERKHLSQTFLSHADVEACAEGFLIKSGMTVDMPDYLEKLFALCKQRGALLHVQPIQAIGELTGYDQIAVAAGAGLKLFEECAELPIRCIKGQLLTCQHSVERSLIGKGYVGRQKAGCVLGSTYEKSYSHTQPDLELAKELILPKISTFFPEVQGLKITGALAGIRVVRNGHYKPIVQKLGEGKWVIGAMGSRGLLYHALAAKELAHAMVTENGDKLSAWTC